MPAIIRAEQQNLVQVFSDTYLFEIPFYQRPYAWEEEEVRELLEDLLNGMNRDSEEPYFLGSVVLIKGEDSPRSEVVDGQQRLTTLTILLCVLRELASETDARQLDQSIRQTGNEFQGTEDRYRISIREEDREFFQDRIQVPGRIDTFLTEDPVRFTDSRKLLQSNARYLREELSKLSESSRRDLAMYVIRNCCLVVVAASEGESAHRIFQVMNDRGRDLTATDILKAEILSKIPSDVQGSYAEKWVEIEDGLGRDRFGALFAHIRMIYRKDKQRGTLQSEFRDAVLNDVSGQQFVDNVLEPYGQVYAIVSEALYESSEDPDSVNVPLRHLSHLDNVDWIPPAMAYFLRNRNHHASLTEFTRDLERLSYGLFILRANVNDRINRHSRVIGSIERGEDLFADDSPLQLTPDEKVKVLEVLDGNIYGKPRIPMPLLMRLNALLYDGGPPENLPWATSIEHVLPQSPSAGSEWLIHFPDAEVRDHLTHRLSNLVLLSRKKNSQASNWDFERKKQEYFLRNGTTPFALTTRVVAEAEWTPQVLERRQQELVNAFKKEWRLD